MPTAARAGPDRGGNGGVWRVVLLGLSIVAIFGAAMSVDSVRDYRRWHEISRDLAGWESVAQAGDDRRLAGYIEELEQLTERHPGDADLHFTAVKLYEWRAYLQSYNRRAARQSLERVDWHLRHVLQARPLWGRAWAAWLGVGARLGDWNPELERRLDTALALGRRDLHAQLYLVPFALEHWHTLPDATHRKLLPFLEETRDRGGQPASMLKRWMRSRPDHALTRALES